ncbi:MAG: hypothetical protein B6U88_00760 [Candidatus Aenigmarchaeota archaeon ex4484_56]|nr:MAG: hypothetical protein B6U88_00760 [Candidatus Aenigmarchaeota archaeon ex4484_56]
MELEVLKEKICKEAKISKEDLEKRINDKILELSGLVSEEGAAYIIAKEEGLDLLEKRDRTLKIKNIIPNIRSIDIIGKVIDISETREFERDGRKGKLQSITVGDETGTIRVIFWNDKIDLLKDVQLEDVIKITQGYSKANSFGIPEIHIRKNSKIEKIDKKIDVKEKKPLFSLSANRVKLSELKENNFAEVRAYIVSVFEREYLSCPECNGKLEEISGNFVCKDHGKVEPVKNLIVKGYLDDGFSTIRFVAFRELAEKIKSELGKEKIFVGRVKMNEYFGDLEFILTQMRDIDINEEIEKLI